MKNSILVLGLVILFLSAGCVSNTKSKIPETIESPTSMTTPQRTSTPPDTLGIGFQDISVQEVMEKIENNGDLTILDVRTLEEFEEGYIQNAIHIPYQELEYRHTELNIPKDEEIIVYCKAGVRSKKGAQQLTEIGYTKVKEMEEGIDGWIEAGGSLVKITTTPTTTPSLTETLPPTHFPKETPIPTTTPTTFPPATSIPQLETTINPYNLNTSNQTKSTYKEPKANC